MAIELSEFLDVLKDSYSAYYTIVEDIECEYPLAFRADYASRDELYLLTKSVKFWGNEKNEYAYIFAAPSFTPALADACMEWAIRDMLPRVKPHKEHQCTNVKVVFVAETVDGETAKTVHPIHTIRRSTSDSFRVWTRRQASISTWDSRSNSSCATLWPSALV